MSSKSGNTAKLLVGVTAFLTAAAGILTAILGTGGVPELIKAIKGSPEQPTASPTTSPTTSGTQISTLNPSSREKPPLSIQGDGNIFGDGIQVGSVQKSGDGNCNNIVASGQGATIICSPGSNNPFGNLGTASNSPIQLQATVLGLQRGSNKLTLLLTNSTPDQSVRISTRDIDISDNFGNTYELDKFAMHGSGLSKTVPPQGQIKVNYILSSPISNYASSLNFTLDNVWAQPRASQYPSPLPQIQWKTNI